MAEASWSIRNEMAAGDMWAAVAEHPPVDGLDRTHAARHTTLGYWMSPERNASSGRFVGRGETAGYLPLGRIVAIPADLPLHVRSEALPARVMLHCRLPRRDHLPLPAEARLDAMCSDLRNVAIRRGLARLAQELAAPGFASASIVEGLGLVIAGELARELAGAGAAPHRGGLAPWQLRRIDDHLAAGHWNSSVSDLARLCGVSAGHLMRAFRQSTGRSVAGHVALLRLERARLLLAADARPIGEIAAELRFARPSAFAAAFRRETGMTPAAFRGRR